MPTHRKFPAAAGLGTGLGEFTERRVSPGSVDRCRAADHGKSDPDCFGRTPRVRGDTAIALLTAQKRQSTGGGYPCGYVVKRVVFPHGSGT